MSIMRSIPAGYTGSIGWKATYVSQMKRKYTKLIGKKFIQVSPIGNSKKLIHTRGSAILGRTKDGGYVFYSRYPYVSYYTLKKHFREV